MKKFAFAIAMSALVLNVSCKNDSATAKIDENATEIAPASPDAVQAPQPNISATPETGATVSTPPADGKYPEMTFAKTEHNFGNISDEKAVTHSFEFKNTGKADLIITSAKGSCGCTVPEYPKQAVKPGESGKIEVSFNPSGKKGQQHKTVTITANTAKGQEKLDVKATIEPKSAS